MAYWEAYFTVPFFSPEIKESRADLYIEIYIHKVDASSGMNTRGNFIRLLWF